MSQDENETQGVVFGVLAGVIFGVIALVVGLGVWKAGQSAAPMETVIVSAEESDIAPVGEALAKVYFAVGSATVAEADFMVVAHTAEALAANPQAIVLLSGFHDESGDPAMNAELAKQRALAVRNLLLAGHIDIERIKLRKPESTLGGGSAEESRRVEIRVQ
jgi:outer membrane protein OmpA-like peptidoglycan-associated protein